MSWQQYIDNLVSNAHIDKAAIIGFDGSTWAASPGLTVSKIFLLKFTGILFRAVFLVACAQ